MLRFIGIVQFCYVMQIVTVTFFCLQLVMTDCKENRQLDPKNDITDNQMKEMLKMSRVFDRQKIKNFLDRDLKFRIFEIPPIINNSSKILFIRLGSDGYYEGIFSKVVCNFKNNLEIHFKSNFVRPSYDVCLTQLNASNVWCSGVESFSLNLKYRMILSIQPWNNVDYLIKSTLDTFYFGAGAEPRNRTIHDMIRDHVYESRRVRIRISEYRPIFEKCLHADEEILNEKHENDYVRLEPYQNMAAFPWISDYNELIITGWNHSSQTSIDFESINNYELNFKELEVEWNIASTEQKQHNIKIRELSVIESQDHLINQVFVKIRIALHNSIRLLDKTLKRELEKVIASGIGEKFEKISHVTSSFTHTINEILQSSDKERFKNSFITKQNRLHIDSTSFSKTETEAFHFESITCVAENLNISAISLKKITGQAEVDFQHFLNANQVIRFLVLVDIYIKEATIQVLLQQHPKFTDEIVHMNPNNPDTTLTIQSKYYKLNQTERILIGRQIFEEFVLTVGNNIFKAAQSRFNPILEICKDSQNDFDGHRYFTVIRDYWATVNPFFTWQTDVTMNGFWNFKQINVQYENENMIIYGLQIENVTGSINMTTVYGSKETRTWNYSMRYFSLIVNHSGMNIRTQLPEPQEYSIILVNSSNTSLLAEKKNIFERFQYTVASYIEKSIYEYSNYRAMFGKLINNVIIKSMVDMPQHYEISSALVHWLAKSLRKWKLNSKAYRFKDYPVFREYYSTIQLNTDILITQKPQSTDMSLTERFNLAGTINFNHIFIKGNYPFEVWRNCPMNVSNELNVDIKNYAMDYLNEKIASDDFWKSELKNLTRSYLTEYLHRYIVFPPPDICKSSYTALNFSRESFYLFNNTIEHTSDYFSKYYIRLHGLQNLESFDIFISEEIRKFEITFKNLTANITWVHNIGTFPSKRPHSMILKIYEMILTGEILISEDELVFTNRSRLQLQDTENPQEMEKLTKTIAPIILDSMQSSIFVEYYRNKDEDYEEM